MINNENELVTIGIPVYNMENSIISAVTSCLNQTYSNIEVLIVDDGSTDNTVSIIKENISDARIRIYTRKHNGGVCAAMRNIVEQAKGKYVCFLDADDTMMPSRVEKQYTAIKSAECRYPSRMVASFCGSLVNDITKKAHYCIDPYDLWNQEAKHPFGGGTGHSMYMVEDIKKFGNFDSRFSRSADSAMCLMFLMNGGFFAMVSEPLITYNFYWDKNKEDTARLENDIFKELRKEIKAENPHNIYLQRYIGTYSYKNSEIKKSVIKLFGFIPFFKLKYKKHGDKIIFYLFGFIPFMTIKNKRK